jgi:hypothetical protein
MKAEEIQEYLSQLGQELVNGGVQKPIHILMIGGAYMLLLMHAPRTTDDVDFFWLEDDEDALQEAIYALRDGIQTVAEQNQLESDWFNYMTHLLMYDLVTIPKGKLWKRYGPLHIHVPPKEYVLALKIIAGREKDITDSQILLPQTKIKTRQQAQQLLDRYIPPGTQEIKSEEIEKSLYELFGEE